MTRKLLFTLLAAFAFAATQAQVISIVGTGVNGWPDNMVGPEMDLTTTDNITYTLSNVAVSTGQVKFRQDHSWTTNWGGSTFPSGTGILNGSNISTVAGTYDITFNRSNGTYTFIGTSAFPSIGIWGPAVDSQNGFGGPDVDMTTADGVIYKLSAFWFSSGSAVFRQNDNPMTTFGSVSFPTGTAVASGPNIPVTGGQYSVTFNRTTGEYSFDYPSVGIMGTFNTWAEPDTDMTTTNGESYTLLNFTMPADGFVKLRQDNSWTVNWGGDAFPNGTLVLNGGDMPVSAGTYDVSFNRSSLNIVFTPSLGVNDATKTRIKVYPNPTKNDWTISGENPISEIAVYDMIGKLVAHANYNSNEAIVNTSGLTAGIYLAKVTSNGASQTFKLVKE